MTRYSPPASCLSPETLALMAAGTLSGAERAAAEAHLATCRDCYDVLMDLAQSAPVSDAAPTPVDTVAGRLAGTRERPRPIIVWSRSIIVWTSLAASLVLAAVMVPRWLGGPERDVAQAVHSLAQSVGASRPSVARLSGGFEWGSAPAITRGTAVGELPLSVQEAVIAIRKLAASAKTVRTLDAVGVAHLVSGDLDASVAALEEAVALDPKDVHAREDLSAVRFEKWRRSLAPVDATAALDAAEQALLLAPADPIARFNHALAVEALGLTSAALDSWNSYLTLDARSKWADEAREHIAKLRGGTAGAVPQATGITASPFHPGAATSPRQIACFDRASRLIDDSRTAYAASRTADSEQFGLDARAAFQCAGAPTFDADAQVAYARYFLGKPVDMPALATLAGAATRQGYFEAAGRINYVLGLNAQRSGLLTHADDYLSTAMTSFTQAGDTEMAAVVSVLMSEVSSARGNLAEAWQRLFRAYPAILVATPRRQHIALVTSSLLATTTGYAGAAKFFADELVAADLKNSTDPVLLMGAYFQSANTTFRLGDQAAALRILDRAMAVYPTIADASMRTQFGAELDELTGTMQLDRDPAKAVVSLTAAMKTFSDLNRVLRRAEVLLIRGRAYRASGDAAAAERDWSEGLGLFEDQRPELRDAQQRIDHLDQLWDLFRELMVVRAASPIGALDVAERFRARALLDALSAQRQLHPLSGTALYDWLPDDVTAVAYAVLPDRLFRWTITRAGVQLDQESVSADRLAMLVEHFRASFQSSTPANADTEALARLLLPAGLDAAHRPHLVFLPDGPLFGVPFAALPLPGGQKLVVDDFTTSVTPSLTVLRSAVAAPRGQLRALLVSAGEANPSESLPALAGVTAEVDAVAPVYPQRTLLDGPRARVATVLAALPLADVVHFAGHAVSDSVAPSRSRLYVSASAQPSSISFDDLRRTPLRPGAIVVLSACDAARGRVFRSEGAVGLTYPFLANGASAVVAALWQVDDATPPVLWQRFHERVSRGAAPDVALAESQRMSRRSGTAPAIWAAFESVGGLARQ